MVTFDISNNKYEKKFRLNEDFEKFIYQFIFDSFKQKITLAENNHTLVEIYTIQGECKSNIFLCEEWYGITHEEFIEQYEWFKILIEDKKYINQYRGTICFKDISEIPKQPPYKMTKLKK